MIETPGWDVHSLAECLNGPLFHEESADYILKICERLTWARYVLAYAQEVRGWAYERDLRGSHGTEICTVLKQPPLRKTNEE